MKRCWIFRTIVVWLWQPYRAFEVSQPADGAEFTSGQCEQFGAKVQKSGKLSEEAILSICNADMKSVSSRCDFIAEVLALASSHSDFSVSRFCSLMVEAHFCSKMLDRLLQSQAVADLALGECLRAQPPRDDAYCKRFKGMLEIAVGNDDLDTLRACYMIEAYSSSNVTIGSDQVRIISAGGRELQDVGSGVAVTTTRTTTTTTTTKSPWVVNPNIVLQPNDLNKFGAGGGKMPKTTAPAPPKAPAIIIEPVPAERPKPEPAAPPRASTIIVEPVPAERPNAPTIIIKADPPARRTAEAKTARAADATKKTTPATGGEPVQTTVTPIQWQRLVKEASKPKLVAAQQPQVTLRANHTSPLAANVTVGPPQAHQLEAPKPTPPAAKQPQEAPFANQTATRSAAQLDAATLHALRGQPRESAAAANQIATAEPAKVQRAAPKQDSSVLKANSSGTPAANATVVAVVVQASPVRSKPAAKKDGIVTKVATLTPVGVHSKPPHALAQANISFATREVAKAAVGRQAVTEKKVAAAATVDKKQGEYNGFLSKFVNF